MDIITIGADKKKIQNYYNTKEKQISNNRWTGFITVILGLSIALVKSLLKSLGVWCYHNNISISHHKLKKDSFIMWDSKFTIVNKMISYKKQMRFIHFHSPCNMYYQIIKHAKHFDSNLQEYCIVFGWLWY